jgi:hypothetical protein
MVCGVYSIIRRRRPCTHNSITCIKGCCGLGRMASPESLELNIEWATCSSNLQSEYSDNVGTWLQVHPTFAILRLGPFADTYKCSSALDCTILRKQLFCSLIGEPEAGITLECYDQQVKFVKGPGQRWIPDPNQERALLLTAEFQFCKVWQGVWNVSSSSDTQKAGAEVHHEWHLNCKSLDITNQHMTITRENASTNVWDIVESNSNSFSATGGRLTISCNVHFTNFNNIELVVSTEYGPHTRAPTVDFILNRK